MTEENMSSEKIKNVSRGCPVKHTERSSGGCPVKSSSGGGGVVGGEDSGWFAFLGVPKSNKDAASSESCGVDNSKTSNVNVASLEEAARHAQTPHPDQVIPLSTHRVVSSIPKGSQENVPKHQGERKDDENWVYPSEQQFYNAVRRKGWQGVDPSTMPLVVRIHNEVNERGWSDVCRWERELHNNHEPKLVKFMGRPKDLSPKAFLFCRLLHLYKEPFDRHDWYVSSSPVGNNAPPPPRRYVIDFYNGQPKSPTTASSQPSMYIDVRPAIDRPEDLWDRMRMLARETFPGIFNALSSTTSASTHTNNSSTSTNTNNRN